ncbi:MAG: hypothetical protein E4H20_02830 [Spirochaetales bacterium]|nr:MAG: hypothetical protein E4H20_02830 [Spirochaetales bacterium]
MKIRVILVAAMMTLAVLSSGFAQEADPRLAVALDESGIKYTVNESGNYVVSYEMDNNPDRSHSVFIISETEDYRGVELREIWSVSAVLYEIPDLDTIIALMEQNSTIKVGAWAMETSDDGEIWILYTVKVPVALTGKQLSHLIYFVAEMCDEFEESYVGDDIY